MSQRWWKLNWTISRRKSGINCRSQTPPVSPSCHLWFPKLRLCKPAFYVKFLLKTKGHKAINTSCTRCMWERDISFRTTYLYMCVTTDQAWMKSSWLDIGQFFLVLRFVLVHKRTKKVWDEYSAVLTDQAWKVRFILKKIFSCRTEKPHAR